MKNDHNIYEFKGSTKQAIADIKEDIAAVQQDVRSLNHKFNLLFALTLIAFIERAPDLVKTVLAAIQ